jgi:branched-subunit amino acid aminotransferase/4-amino-4-deoxychorismate lyase
MTKYCFLNGEVLPEQDAKILIIDIGLLRGYGVYDGLAVILGKPIRLTDHWQRFVRGAKALNIKVPVSEEFLNEKIIEIVEKSGFSTRANIRIILTGGETISGIGYDFDKPTFCVTLDEWKALPKENYENGAKLITYSYRREMPEIKTTNYITAVNLQSLIKKQGALEILYTHDGEVLECATSNIFLVKDNVLITPVEGVLEGITRKIVLELAEGDYKIERRKVAKADLGAADEIFITSSFKDIVPIVEIDDFAIGDGKVGPVTRDLMDKFAKYLA